MSKDKRHSRELAAAMNQIKKIRTKAGEDWRLEMPLWKLAVEGLGMFAVAFMTGLGFGVIFDFFTKG